MREASHRSSNWRAEQALHEYLVEAGVVGIEGLDTRAVTRHVRDHGSQPGVISHVDLDPRRAVEKAKQAPPIVGRDLVSEVTCRERYDWIEGTGEWSPWLMRIGAGPESNHAQGPGRQTIDGHRFRVVVYDFGVKLNILRRLIDMGCDVVVVPASTAAAQVAAGGHHTVQQRNQHRTSERQQKLAEHIANRSVTDQWESL